MSSTSPAPKNTTSTAAAASEIESRRRSLPVELPVTLHRYLRWLLQLQASIDAVCDDAYTLDCLTLQGVLPLRQRSAPPTAAQAGLKAAVYELLVGAAERHNAALRELRQHHRALKLSGAVPGRGVDRKAATFSQFSPPAVATASDGTPAGAAAASAVITHNSTPPCPCHVFLAQQRAASVEQRPRSSSSRSRTSSGQDLSDDEKEEGEKALDASGSSGVGRVNVSHWSSSRNDDQVTAAADGGFMSVMPGSPYYSPRQPPTLVMTSAVSASFPARLKDTVSAGSSVAAMARTLTTHSPRASRTLSSLSNTSCPPGYGQPTLSYLHGASQRTAAAPAVVAQLLLPLTAAPSPPLRPQSGATESAGEAVAEKDGDDDLTMGGLSPSATAAVPSPSPIPVSIDTLPSRTLHDLWSYIAPEEVRRCSLCSGQLMIEHTWHALYLMQLLTLMSAVPSMAAPLPLPPPSVLRMQPVEAFLLLFHTAQRCFVTGVTLGSAVAVPSTSRVANTQKGGVEGGRSAALSASVLFETKGHVPLTTATVTASSALDVLHGGRGGDAPVSSLALPSPLFSTGAAQQQQQANKEDYLLSALTQSVFGVVDAVGGVAAPLLWPIEHDDTTPVSPTLPAKKDDGITRLRGDTLALRFRAFHAAFLVLVTRDGASRAASALLHTSKAAGKLLAALQGAPYRKPVDGAAEGDVSQAIYDNLTYAFTLLTAAHRTTASASAVEGGASGSRDDHLAFFYDDLRALCCVIALLTVFAGLVQAQETEPPVLSPDASVFRLSDAATHVVDDLMYPTLLELQNSARGTCSSQARPLLALWWLIRAETVRQVAQLHRNAAVSTNTTATTWTTVKVLGQEIDLLGDDAEEARGDEVGTKTVHWSTWLKEVSRAAVRASNAASEFLDLTLRRTPVFGVASPLLSTAQGSATLRWQLPLDTPTTAAAAAAREHTKVAPLPLAWLRMWLLLCPPLFHTSPADVLALRHAMQPPQQQQQEKEDLKKTQTDSAAAPSPTPVQATSSSTAARNVSRVTSRGPPQRNHLARKAGGAEEGQGERTVRVKAGPATSGSDANPSKPVKMVKADAPKHVPVVVDKDLDKGGGRSRGWSHYLSNSTVLQSRLRYSTEPVCFWVRWCQLFLPASPSPLPQRREERSHSSVKGGDPTPAMSLSRVTAAVSDAVAVLRSPSHASIGRSFAPALLPTQLVDSLHRAFPLWSAHDLAKALEAQVQLFVATAPARTAASASARSAFFASYSFAMFLSPLRDVVNAVSSARERGGQEREETEMGSPRVSSQAAASSSSPPSPLSSSSSPSPCVASEAAAGVEDGQLNPPSSLSNDTTVRQSTRTAVRRPPLMATRTLPRRVREGEKSLPSLPPSVSSKTSKPAVVALFGLERVLADLTATDAASTSPALLANHLQ